MSPKALLRKYVIPLTMCRPYPTDLPDDEWNFIESYMPAPKGHGRLSIHDFREILKAVFFYVPKSGYQWRLLPHDFPRWSTPYHHFRRWRIETALGRGSTGYSRTPAGSPEKRSSAQ